LLDCCSTFRLSLRSQIETSNENSDPRIREAIRIHGDECIGLLIGIRAVDIVTKELAISETERVKVTLGTKQCLGDAFKALLHLQDNQIVYVEPHDDVIRVVNGTDLIELHLTPSKLREISEVQKATDAELFPLIRKLRN